MLVLFLIFLSKLCTSSSGFKFSPDVAIMKDTNSDLMESIAGGTQIAVQQCQNLFQWSRWNCPKSTFNRQQKSNPTKETAFTKAITSAGITYAITRNCSVGLIEGCRCQTTPNNPTGTYGNLPNGTSNSTWSWGGCSDSTEFASGVTKTLMDSLETGFDAQAYVNRHNAQVGIKLVQKSMVKKCRCHGVSGSCTTQTCWLQAAPFEKISTKLKEMHRKAVRVTYKAVETSIVMGNSARGDFVELKEIPGTRNKLIYLERSPDYCLANYSDGYVGTRGRMCSRNRSNATKMEKNSCRNLCKKCGHGVKRTQKKVTRRCNCKFSWCCEVKCDSCSEIVDEHFCS